jgi:hypothetical protein
MSPLNIHPEEEVSMPKKRKNKTLKVMLGIAALVAVPVVGTTLAATIAINGGGANTVNFGQGVIVAAACDSTITVTPYSDFDEGSNTFKLSSVKVSTLDPAACASKTLRLRFYPTTGGTDDPLGVAATASPAPSTPTALVVTLPASGTTAPTKETNADYLVSTLSSATAESDFTITLTTKPAASSIDRITIESF